MTSSFDLYQLAKESTYDSIRKLHDSDGISWEMLSEWAGFKGPASLRNVINQDTHNLDFTRGCMLLKQASKVKNLRAHKHTLDTIQWEIVERNEDVVATGDLKQEIVEASKAMGKADDALQAGNVEALINQYRMMQKVISKMRAEIETSEIRFKKQNNRDGEIS